MAEPRHLEALTVEECFDLVRHQVGRPHRGRSGSRAALRRPRSPSSSTRSGVIVFLATPAEKLDAVDHHVSFQVDGFDPAPHRVERAAQGTCRSSDDADAPTSSSTRGSDPPALLRLVPDVVTGRRLVLDLPTSTAAATADRLGTFVPRGQAHRPCRRDAAARSG